MSSLHLQRFDLGTNGMTAVEPLACRQLTVGLTMGNLMKMIQHAILCERCIVLLIEHYCSTQSVSTCRYSIWYVQLRCCLHIRDWSGGWRTIEQVNLSIAAESFLMRQSNLTDAVLLCIFDRFWKSVHVAFCISLSFAISQHVYTQVLSGALDNFWPRE